MEARIDLEKVSPGVLQAMFGLGNYLNQIGLDPKLQHLIQMRASQINGCAYCIDMHWKDARAEGETEQRLYGLDAWQESPYYTDRERAALAWTEAVTLVSKDHVPDGVFQEASRFFSEKELVDLTLCIVAINGWNRLCIPFRAPAGTYQPKPRERRAKARPMGAGVEASH